MIESHAAGSTWLGIVAGLFSGACMSLSYLLSRHHALGYPAEVRQKAACGLLVRSHLIMGAVAAPLAAWLGAESLPHRAGYLLPLLASAGFYLGGNVLFFGLLRRVEASRLTPFLGLKVFVLSLIVATFLGQPLSATQWMAVALSVVATALLQGGGGGLGGRDLGRILLVCTCFALADLFIVRLIDVLDTSTAAAPRRLLAAVEAMLLTYMACGMACGAALSTGRFRTPAGRDGDAWRAAGRYAAAWLVAMVTLYVCFSLIGAVFGNVVQSTRGILSVVIGALLAHLGWHELEQRVDRATLARRIGAAVLMTAAIAVYVM